MTLKARLCATLALTYRKRLLLFLSLFLYYCAELVVFQTKAHELKGERLFFIEELVTVCALSLCVSLLALTGAWVFRPHFEHNLFLLHAALCALSVAWLLLACRQAAAHGPFFAINIIIVGLLVLSDWSLVSSSSASSSASLLSLFLRSRARKYDPLQSQRESERESEDPKAVDIEMALPVASHASQDDAHTHTQAHTHAEVVRGVFVDTTDRRICEGFRVNYTALPVTDGSIRADVQWTEFESVSHVVDSSSCHIYTATWQGERVILKLIKAERVSSAVALAEFDIEFQVLSRVKHPNVVRLLGAGALPRKFLILELLGGGSLADALGLRPDAPLPVPPPPPMSTHTQTHTQPYTRARAGTVGRARFTQTEALRFALSLARALRYLHHEYSEQMHILHRDLKPDNIGWTSDGTLKLFDFGLCACVRTQRDLTESFRLTGNTGTLRYMAPEVVLNRSYNQSVDVYSFAILLWQVLTQKVPFHSMGKKMFFDHVVVGGTRLKLDPHWPRGLTELLTRCWQEDKLRRPSFRDIVPEIEVLLREAEAQEKEREKRMSNRCVRQLWAVLANIEPLLLCVLFCVCVASVFVSVYTPRVSLGAILGGLASFALYALCTWRLYCVGERPPDLSLATEPVAETHTQTQMRQQTQPHTPSLSHTAHTQTHTYAQASRTPSSQTLSRTQPSEKKSRREREVADSELVAFNPLTEPGLGV